VSVPDASSGHILAQLLVTSVLYSRTLASTSLGFCLLIGGIQHVGANINLVFSLLKLSQYFYCVILHNFSIVLKELEFILNPETNGQAVMNSLG